MSSVTREWEGYFLNYLTADNTPNFHQPYLIPNNIDWHRNLAPGVYLEADPPVDYKFKWAYKVWKLYVNPFSENLDLLDEPEIIVVGKYNYGEFIDLNPSKQDLILYCKYRDRMLEEPVFKPYHTIRNPLKKIGSRVKRAKKRRATTEAYIEQRAQEIDSYTNSLFESLGEAAAKSAGLQQLDLVLGIKKFFKKFSNEMFLYYETGNLDINTAIADVMTETSPDPSIAWLKENILIGQNEDNSFKLVPAGLIIQRILTDGVAKITQNEIDQVFNDAGFVIAE